MFCSQCGQPIDGNVRFCSSCGAELQPVSQSKVQNRSDFSSSRLVGFSSRINDPAFAKYIKNSNRYAAIFAIAIALIAVIGFTIYGANSSEMGNPQAFFIGCGIGAMFIIIALFQIKGRNRDSTWDGSVVDKKVEKKRRKRNTTDDDYYTEDYLEYKVFITGDNGKKHTIRVENDDTIYNYYKIGDRVRHHRGLNSFEKYDKSKDTVIFCNACAAFNKISDDYCHRCKCPLLK